MKSEDVKVSRSFAVWSGLAMYFVGLALGAAATAVQSDDDVLPGPLHRWLVPAKLVAARPTPDAAPRDLPDLPADAPKVFVFVPAALPCYSDRRDPFFATPSYSAAGHEVLPYPPAEVP